MATPNVGVNTRDELIGPRRDYSINFTTTGTYYVWARMKAPSGSDKSFHVGLNGVATSLGSLGLQDLSGQWAWTNTMKNLQRVAIEVTSPGTHTFNLWMREDGVLVDAFILTREAGFVPA